jgi:gluconolactonase
MHSKNVRMLIGAASAAIALTVSSAIAQAPPAPPPPIMPPSLPPTFVANMMTQQDASALGVQWRTMDARIVETKPVEGALPQYKTTYDIAPHAGEAGFDDSKWPAIAPQDLAVRRSGGHVAFVWYRTNLTIPAKIGNFDTTGAKAVVTILVDDYAEVWVNGQMARQSGYPSPATIQGLNLPNRVVISDSVKPGDKFQIAVFGINGPISVAPANMVWFREAQMEFYK